VGQAVSPAKWKQPIKSVAVPAPSIAVITPVRNGIAHLHETIQSVVAQKYSSLEMIVIDDGSTDGSGALARSTGSCRVIETPLIGPAGARNAGITASKSDLLFFLDADDLLCPWAFDSPVDALLRAPDAGFAQGCVRNFNVRPDGSIHLFTAPYRFINLGSGLWRRTVFETVGLLDESLQYCEDLDFFMRCWERDIHRVPVDCVMFYYRRHPGNMTRGLKGAGFGTVRAYRKRIERIRAGEYDPHSPRRVTWPEYFGRGPDIMDLE
jgi:glycosyltransferase involved in cell wall biosynthesis